MAIDRLDHEYPAPGSYEATGIIPSLHAVDIDNQSEASPTDETYVIGITAVDEFSFGRYKSRSCRIERVELSNGNTLTATVSEPDPYTITDEPGCKGSAFIVRGFGEISSAKNSSANNLHKEYALRRPRNRTVSVDRLGYSPHDEPSLPWESFKVGLEKDDAAVSDLLAVARYYALDQNNQTQPITLLGVSAGFTKVLEMVQKNKYLPPENRININNELLGIVPCLVAKNSPEGSTFYRKKEPEPITQLKITSKFGLHTAANFGESMIYNPLGTLSCAGIIGTLAVRPHLLCILPPQFWRHMSGIDFQLLLDVTEHHKLRIVQAEKDPLRADAQWDKVNEINNGSIMYRTEPGEGHISLPIKVGKALDALGITSYEPTTPNSLEVGLSAVANSVFALGNFVTKQLKA